MQRPSTTRPTRRGPTVRSAPRIYGDSESFKGVLTRQIARGEHLLDELEGVRLNARAPATTKRATSLDREVNTLMGYYRLRQWTERVARWRSTVVDLAERQLADQAQRLLPRAFKGVSRVAGTTRSEDTPRVERWLREALDELRSVRASLGVRRNVATSAPARFDELRASGLIDGAVIDGWVQDVAAPRTPKQLADAIGTAKEIAEASLRAGLDRLNVRWTDRDSLTQLMKKWRDAAHTRGLDPAGAQQLDHALAALGNLLAFLAEFRNAYGRGHGRSRYPAGIRVHHARLAVDIADTVARFVVLTTDDMARLPPARSISSDV